MKKKKPQPRRRPGRKEAQRAFLGTAPTAGNHGPTHSEAARHDTDTAQDPKRNANNQSHSGKAGWFVSLFTGKDAHHWWIVFGTWFVAISAVIFGVCQLQTYKTTTHTENRAYLSVIEPQWKPEWNRAFFVIKNLGKTPAYKVRMNVKFISADTLIYSPDSLRQDENAAGFYVGPEFPSPHYVKIDTATKGTKLYLYGKIFYADKFDEPHYTMFGFTYEWGIANFQLVKDFNDAN